MEDPANFHTFLRFSTSVYTHSHGKWTLWRCIPRETQPSLGLVGRKLNLKTTLFRSASGPNRWKGKKLRRTTNVPNLDLQSESNVSITWPFMDDADVPLASLVSSQDPDPEVLQGSPSPSRARAPESSQSPTGGLEWLEDSAFPRKLKLKLRKLRYSPGAELRQSSTSRVQAGSLEMRSRSSIPMFPSTGRPVVKGKVGGGYESSLGALRRVRKKKYNFPDADEVVSLRAWHESTERIQSSWKEHSAEAERGVPFLDLVPVIGGSGCRGQNAVNMPFGHIAKERFEYNEFEETNKEFQASVVPRPKTQPARPGTRMIGKMRRPLIQIKEDFMSITSITSFHRLCKVQR